MSAAETMAALAPAERRAVVAALDEISRPLTVRELDRAFARANVPRSVRRPAIRALASFDIIALEPTA